MEQLNLGVVALPASPTLERWRQEDYKLEIECKALLHHMRLSLKN